MKAKSLIVGLGLLSCTAMADTYNAQVDIERLERDDVDTTRLSGTYYFEKVTTDNTAWVESAFMGRNSNVSVGYSDFSGGSDALSFAGEFFGKDGNNLYGAIEVIDVDPDIGESDTVLIGELGYFFDKNWLVSISAIDSDFEDSVSVNTKYVGALGGDRYFNVEATYNDESEDVTVIGDYYWSAQTGAGLILSDAEGFDYGLRFQHFFNNQVALKLSYWSADFDDTTGIAVTARF
ncbi:putative porin [Aliikangiella coralliicola]|uniref:Putative porin n=1 Tax=Aliikangiella coralliicola TaxID=2592383 RepID=A0A545TUZ9_9GAMM|nr:putative porin [Aliikangiella coralliicola]TQV81053.1 putative porin [Aliikangiella coralliicola]